MSFPDSLERGLGEGGVFPAVTGFVRPAAQAPRMKAHLYSRVVSCPSHQFKNQYLSLAEKPLQASLDIYYISIRA